MIRLGVIMKKLKYLFCMIITFLFGIYPVLAASSNFDTSISMDPYITENQVKLVLGFTGEEIMIVNQTLSYDSNYLKLVDVVAMDNFTITTSKEKSDGKYRTIEILADSDYSFNESNYCIVIFSVNSKFKTKKKSDIFLYNVESTGPNKEKYRVKGNIITMDRESTSVMNLIIEDIKDSTKIKYWFINHAILLIIIAIVIVAAIVLFVLFFPSHRKQEKRDNDVSEQIKPDNYNPNNTIKIDPEAVSKIGVVEKPIDMKEAIIVDENVKPFGEIVGKSEVTTTNNQNTDINPNLSASVFDIRTPDSPIVADGNLTSINLQENSSPQTESPSIDAFNIKATPEEKVDNLETLEELPTTPQDNQKDGLITINTQTIESSAPISVEEVPQFPVDNDPNNNNNTNNNNNNNNNNPPNVMILLFFLALSSFFLMMPVEASEEEYRVSELRDVIVGKMPTNLELDYNNDGQIDILDLIATKNLVNCNFESLMNTDPGFAELHGHSNNLISVDPNRTTTTKKGKTTKTTTTTAKANKTTTTKKSNSNNSNSKTTTTKTTKTTKTTTTKTATPTYNITIKATNGTVSPESITLEAGKSTNVTLTANEGYTITKDNISCTNISFSLSSSKKLVLSKPTGNATCNVNFVGSSNIKVVLKYVLGKGSSKSDPTISYGSYTSKSYTGTLNSTWTQELSISSGYKVTSGYPTCGTYANGTFSLVIPTSSTTCELKFDPILYSVSISGGSPYTSYDSKIYYNESKKISYTSTTKYKQVNCGGKVISVTNNKLSDDSYKGSFTYKHEVASNVTCSLIAS